MSLIYVTGIETAGKTTMCHELKKLGYEAYDIDEGIAHYYSKVTGERSEWLSSVEARNEDWHKQNDYTMDREHVERLAMRAKDKIIILCGTTHSDEVVLDLFDKVIYLSLDEDTLKQRITARRSGEFAFAEHEIQAILGWHKSSEETYQERGATMIDATQPVERVIAQVIAAVC